jgi:hypothetical protein
MRCARQFVSALFLILSLSTYQAFPQSQQAEQSGAQGAGSNSKASRTSPNCRSNGTYVNGKGQVILKTAVPSRDVIGWVVAKEIGHWNLPSTSEIDRKF